MEEITLNGFTFNGKHSSEFGLYYIPSPANRMQNTPDFELREATVTGHHGGYYYGSQAKIREMTLECYFEGITLKTFEDMICWIHSDNKGDQVFDDRPFVVYSAVVWKKPTGKVYTIKNENDINEVYSGTISIFFKCYEPFGKMTYNAYDTYDVDGAMAHCGIIEKSEMPDKISPSVGTYLVYNPGTEVCDTIIRVAGSAPNGLTIENSSGDICKQVSLPSSGYLEINSDYGTVKAMPTNELAFEYHDDGYIRLLPCTPYERDVEVVYTEDSNIVSFSTRLTDNTLIGRYMRLNGEWLRIVSINSDDSVIVNKRLSISGTEHTMIAAMNELTVSGDGASLTQFEIEYVPLLR